MRRFGAGFRSNSGHSPVRDAAGQSLIETAIALPLLLVLGLNAVNFGYALFCIVNVAGATRTATEYSIQGTSSVDGSIVPFPSGVPPAGNCTTSTSVSYLSLQDMGGIVGSGTVTGVQVCSQSVAGSPTPSGCSTNLSTTTGCIAPCAPDPSCPSSQAYTPTVPDPEPGLYLYRVDVTYQFTPLIKPGPFNILNLGGALLNIHRQVSMRGLN